MRYAYRDIVTTCLINTDCNGVVILYTLVTVDTYKTLVRQTRKVI